MRRVAAFVALAGLAGFSVAGMALRDRFVTPAADASLERPAAAPGDTIPEAAAPAAIATPHAPARIRPVAPDVVAAPPVDYGRLERVEPRNPLSEIGVARSPAEGPPKQTILFRPLATGGGSFLSLGHKVELAGIVPTAASETCVSDGVSWPCGVHARTAFRNWLRGRALSCVVPPVPTAETVVTDCRLGKQDPAAWLVSFGWALAEPRGPYHELEQAARDARRGMFAAAPAVAEPARIGTEVPVALPGAATVDPPLVSEPLPETSGGSGG